jgi:hypothetical protein
MVPIAGGDGLTGRPACGASAISGADGAGTGCSGWRSVSGLGLYGSGEVCAGGEGAGTSGGACLTDAGIAVPCGAPPFRLPYTKRAARKSGIQSPPIRSAANLSLSVSFLLRRFRFNYGSKPLFIIQKTIPRSNRLILHSFLPSMPNTAPQPLGLFLPKSCLRIAAVIRIFLDKAIFFCYTKSRSKNEWCCRLRF